MNIGKSISLVGIAAVVTAIVAAVDATAVNALVVKHAGGSIEDFVFGGAHFYLN